MNVTESLARLRKLSPHAFSGDNRTAAEYVKHRGEGLAAMNALRYARAEDSARAFEWRFNSESAYRTSFCNDSPIAVYELESRSRRFRVELAFLPDYDCERGDEFDPEAERVALWSYFRTERKFGRTAAREAVAEAIAANVAAEAERGRNDCLGVICRVFWNVPKLEAGEPLGEDSCWGFEVSDGIGFDAWNFARDIAANAICEAVRKVRAQHREAMSLRRSFGFILPAEPMGAA